MNQAVIYACAYQAHCLGRFINWYAMIVCVSNSLRFIVSGSRVTGKIASCQRVGAIRAEVKISSEKGVADRSSKPFKAFEWSLSPR